MTNQAAARQRWPSACGSRFFGSSIIGRRRPGPSHTRSWNSPGYRPVAIASPARPGAAGRHVIHGDRQLGRSRAQRFATMLLVRQNNESRFPRSSPTNPAAEHLSGGPGVCFGETVSDTFPVTERTIETNGVQLHTVEAGEPGAPVVVLAHGFPELAYSWRHQIPVLAAAGYHVLAPDQRGYGRSTRPAAIADYNLGALSGDLVGLLDHVGAEKAVFIGHDWGASVVWSSAQLHPDRVAGVVGLSVPPVPRAQIPPTQAFRAVFGDNFFYMLYFQEPGVADAELAADPAKTLRRVILGQAAPGDQAAAMRMLRPGPEGLLARIPGPDGP